VLAGEIGVTDAAEQDYGADETPLAPWPIAGAKAGWLSPDGVFYDCASYEHESYAVRLNKLYGYEDHYNGSRSLEQHGWFKLKYGEWMIVAHDECTQKQLDALFDWCQSKGRTLESLELL
jgi:hypothetical protein